MDAKEATRTCGQCHREVAEANLALHEMHCSRFLCVCPDCKDTVPREQLEQHREEQHTLVRCSKCDLKMQRCRLADHESDECEQRLRGCQFCELEMPWKDLEEHQVACGSRTELCRECRHYVMLRDMPEHGSACSATDSDSRPPQTTNKLPTSNTKVTVRCGRCTRSFPPEDIDEHELQCVSASRSDDGEDDSEHEEREKEGHFFAETSRLSSAYKSAPLSDRGGSGPWADGDPDMISTCPYCHLALPLFTLRWHKVKCQIHIQLK